MANQSAKSKVKKKRKLQHVWLQTQFDYVEFLQSRIGDKKCVSNKLTIKVGVSSFLWCPGTSAPASGVPEATQEASRKPLKGAASAQKAFSGSQIEAQEFLMETERKVFLY